MEHSITAETTRLLEALEKIGDSHGEIYDTMVREMMADAIYAHFIFGRPIENRKTKFGLYKDDGNKQVGETIYAYLETVMPKIGQQGLASPRQRLTAFQSADICTKNGITTDEFFGYLPPEEVPDTDAE